MLGGNLDSEEIEALETGDSGSSPAFTCDLLCIWGELLSLSEPVSPTGKKGKRMHDHTQEPFQLWCPVSSTLLKV